MCTVKEVGDWHFLLIFVPKMQTETVQSQGAIQVDLDAILSERLGWRRKFIPGFLVRKLESIIRQERINAVLRELYPARGAEFCCKLLELLNVNIKASGITNLPATPRCLFVSNHPLGGLDGIATIAYLYKHYGVEPLFVVNDLLMALEPLRDVFIPVNKHGRQNRFTVSSLEVAMSSDRPVVIYPAGLVSRLGKDGVVSDLKWRKSFVPMALASGRDVVPMYFDGANSAGFYKLARRREKLGIKFNIEMILLPGEMFDGEGKSFTLNIGVPVKHSEMSRRPDAAMWCATIRDYVYSLGKSVDNGR